MRTANPIVQSNLEVIKTLDDNWSNKAFDAFKSHLLITRMAKLDNEGQLYFELVGEGGVRAATTKEKVTLENFLNLVKKGIINLRGFVGQNAEAITSNLGKEVSEILEDLENQKADGLGLLDKHKILVGTAVTIASLVAIAVVVGRSADSSTLPPENLGQDPNSHSASVIQNALTPLVRFGGEITTRFAQQALSNVTLMFGSLFNFVQFAHAQEIGNFDLVTVGGSSFAVTTDNHEADTRNYKPPSPYFPSISDALKGSGILNIQIANEDYDAVKDSLVKFIREIESQPNDGEQILQLGRAVLCGKSMGFDYGFFHLLAVPLVEIGSELGKYELMLDAVKDFLLKTKILPEEVFAVVDKNGNTPLHAMIALTTTKQFSAFYDRFKGIISQEFWLKPNSEGHSPHSLLSNPESLLRYAMEIAKKMEVDLLVSAKSPSDVLHAGGDMDRSYCRAKTVMVVDSEGERNNIPAYPKGFYQERPDGNYDIVPSLFSGDKFLNGEEAVSGDTALAKVEEGDTALANVAKYDPKTPLLVMPGKLFEAIKQYISDGESYLDLVLKSVGVKLKAARDVVPERAIGAPKAELLEPKERGDPEL